jgi:hypothetical protein
MNQKPIPIAITIAEASALARVGRTLGDYTIGIRPGFPSRIYAEQVRPRMSRHQRIWTVQ